MPKNTGILIAILAVIAALLIGFNIGKMFNSQPSGQLQTQEAVTLSPTPTPVMLSQYKGCGILFSYPVTLSKMEAPEGALFVDKETSSNSFAVACQKGIPRPALIASNIEAMKIGSVSATLYHDGSEKDGTPVDKLIFTHPATKLDVYLSGYGNQFTSILSTLQIQ
jgi:hypothetical protein